MLLLEGIIDDGLTVYQKGGLLALIVFLLLLFIALLVVFVRKTVKDQNDSTKEVTKALTESTAIQQTSVETMESLKGAISELTKAQQQHLAYMQQRDEFFGRGGGRGGQR